MCVAAIYDIHANLPALEAVIDDVRQVGVGRVVVGGDVVPGPMPHETLARLLDLDLPIHFIQGNGEVAVLAEMAGQYSGVPEQFRAGLQWNAQQLTSEDTQLLDSWPKTLRLEIPNRGEVLFCHATPRNEKEIFTHATAEERVLPAFAGVDRCVLAPG